MGETTEAALLVDQLPDDVVLITLNRPRAKNAVSFEMWAEFSAALDRIETGTPPRALVLRGAGDYFSRGGDMKVPPARGAGALSAAARLEMGQRIITRLRNLPVPVIAAVEGGAFGIGWSLAMACDIILVSETAVFGAPFVNFGVVPDGGSAWFLSRRIGRYRAAELIFSGRTITAEEALALGLASRVVPAGTAVAAACEFAATLGQGNRHAAELTKRLLQGADSGDLAANHALELAYCAICQAGPEVARGREAFANLKTKSS